MLHVVLKLCSTVINLLAFIVHSLYVKCFQLPVFCVAVQLCVDFFLVACSELGIGAGSTKTLTVLTQPKANAVLTPLNIERAALSDIGSGSLSQTVVTLLHTTTVSVAFIVQYLCAFDCFDEAQRVFERTLPPTSVDLLTSLPFPALSALLSLLKCMSVRDDKQLAALAMMHRYVRLPAIVPNDLAAVIFPVLIPMLSRLLPRAQHLPTEQGKLEMGTKIRVLILQFGTISS
jgi:hypothetical protein